mgnify:CR=1 FL=1
MITRRNSLQYDDHKATEMAWIIDNLNLKMSMSQQYTYTKGLEKFGDKGISGIEKEIGQLHDCTCFTPIHIHDMNPSVNPVHEV